MGRSRKKSVSQKIVGVATTGMPSPIRKLLGLKLVALLIVLTVPVLFATGLLQVRWVDGRPKISFNRTQTQEIRDNATERVGDIREARNPNGARHSLLGPHEGVLGSDSRQAEKPLSDVRGLFDRR